MALLSPSCCPLRNARATLPLLLLAALTFLPFTSYAASTQCQGKSDFFSPSGFIVEAGATSCQTQCPGSYANGILQLFNQGTSSFTTAGTRAPQGDESRDACCSACSTTAGCQGFVYQVLPASAIANTVSGPGCYLLSGQQCDAVDTYNYTPGVGVFARLCPAAQATPGPSTLPPIATTATPAPSTSSPTTTPVPAPTLPPLPSARCKANVQLSATSGCLSATPQVSDVDDGSTVGDNTTPQLLLTNADGTAVAPLSLGSHGVTLTVTDAYQQSATCSSTITVSDGEPLSPSLVECPGSPSATVITPPQANTASAAFASTYNNGTNTKANGCPVTVAITGSHSCDRCNPAGKHVRPDCQITLDNNGRVLITESGGVGDYISWTTTVIDLGGAVRTQSCGVCVARPGASKKDSNCKSSWVPGTPAPCS